MHKYKTIEIIKRWPEFIKGRFNYTQNSSLILLPVSSRVGHAINRLKGAFQIANIGLIDVEQLDQHSVNNKLSESLDKLRVFEMTKINLVNANKNICSAANCDLTLS